MKNTRILKENLYKFLKNKEYSDLKIEPNSYIFGDVYTFTLTLIHEKTKESTVILTTVFKNESNTTMSHYEDLFAEESKKVLKKVLRFYED